LTVLKRTIPAGRGPSEAECPAPAALGLTHRIYPDGHATAVIRGELDAATADAARDYVAKVIARSSGPLAVDLTGLSFCDARGLRALVGMAACARTAGRKLSLTGTRPGIIKIMRITGVDANFPELRGQQVPSA
jgi:anti-sigma B factor antagonist